MSKATTLPSLKELLEAGVHFGHQRARTHPRARSFTYTIRDGVYIINLEQTIDLLQNAIHYLKEALANHKTILFIGTKEQFQDVVEQAAKTLSMPYVTNRWLGGTLTNFDHIASTAKRLIELENILTPSNSSSPSHPSQTFTKKERLILQRELESLKEKYEGLKSLTRLPDVLFIVDPKHEHTALAEAQTANIPVVAILDTTTNPDQIQVPIPANDDARRSVEIILKTITEALTNKESQKSIKSTTEEKKRPSKKVVKTKTVKKTAKKLKSKSLKLKTKN